MKVYSLAGYSIQQINGKCPDGWIEMECERPSNAHVATSDGKWITPVKTMQQKIAEAVAAYSTVIESLKSQTLSAIMTDVEQEAAKLTQIRAELADAKANYIATLNAIKAGEL